MGYSVSGAGDVDNDGFDDFLIGGYYASGINNWAGYPYVGMAYLILGKSLGSTSALTPSTADYRFEGECYYDSLGWAVASAGDVDGDGIDDLVVTKRWDGDDDPGIVNLHAGPFVRDQEDSDAVARIHDSDGRAAAAGDVDHNGTADVMVRSLEGDGALFLNPVAGAYSLDDDDFTLVEWDETVTGSGDIDGDGVPEFFVHGVGGVFAYPGMYW
jgi:hypothetical protein